ncbi:MAG: hypothetical protein IT370_15245 [Deltaproteobacteria bacterium]|nr:hypothetical protein [Deltaproteobacteria bacterium]
MPSVHDNHLLGYDVDCDARRIVVRTEFREVNPVEKTDVIFEGVEAYAFRHDCFGTIIFEFREEDFDTAVLAHWAELDVAARQSGSPRFWGRDDATTRARLETLKQQGAKWLELHSSIGMEGWIFCRTIEYRAR